MSAFSKKTASVHVPVLVREVLRALELQPGLTVVDGTFGGGGHAAKILEQIGDSGRLIGLDRDPQAIARAASLFPQPNVSLHSRSYVDLPELLAEIGVAAVDRVLVDLGLSSDQLADDARGFSFQSDGPLDLRFDATTGVSASELLQTVSEQELTAILHDYGEEPAARRLAQAMLRQQAAMPIRTAAQLAAVVVEALGPAGPRDKHPATRVFQALRIAVNRELEHVQRALEEVFPQVLKPGGLLAVITFHSLEDRLVKDAFRRSDVWNAITPKPIAPTPAETRVNPRSRSAKLRVARRVGGT